MKSLLTLGLVLGCVGCNHMRPRGAAQIGVYESRDVVFKLQNGETCGVVYPDGEVWTAQAELTWRWQDDKHSFKTREDAIRWLTERWCKP